MENKSLTENLTETITQTLKDIAKTENVIGKPFKLGEFSVVPVMKVSMGFGTGGGRNDNEKEGKEAGAGGGGGISVEPMAFLVAYGNEVDLLNLGKGKGLEAIFECMPTVIGQTGKAIKNLFEKEKDNVEKDEETDENKKKSIKFNAKNK